MIRYWRDDGIVINVKMGFAEEAMQALANMLIRGGGNPVI